MPAPIRLILIAIGLIFVTAGVYFRIQSQRSGESLDRRKEGWLLLIAIRLSALLTLAATVLLSWQPPYLEWSLLPTPIALRWLGVAGFAASVAWLLWMFRTLGRNLTDTVVTRKDAYFVDHGPYRFVRNPMYTGILMIGASLGLAIGTWLVPLLTSFVFTLIAVRTRIEERYLVEHFGDHYRAYMRRVGRFLPKI